MLYLTLKAALSGIIVAAASETARRSPALGALIVSLPLTSLLALIWLWQDSGDSERIAALAQSTFWYVLPTLPMFLLMPVMFTFLFLNFPSGLVIYWLVNNVLSIAHQYYLNKKM
jgi:hypothetical protein